MNGGQCCPRCGHLLDAPWTHGVDFQLDTIETLHREVRFLRETIARLRGGGAGRSDAGPLATNHPTASR